MQGTVCPEKVKLFPFQDILLVDSIILDTIDTMIVRTLDDCDLVRADPKGSHIDLQIRLPCRIPVSLAPLQT